MANTNQIDSAAGGIEQSIEQGLADAQSGEHPMSAPQLSRESPLNKGGGVLSPSNINGRSNNRVISPKSIGRRA